MPWYKLSRRDCATVTHLYKLSPNTEQRHAMRTVRNIVKEHRWALVHHIEESMRPPHGIMGRLCRHVTIFYCSLPASVHQHKADITIYLNAFHKYMFSSFWLISWLFAIKKEMFQPTRRICYYTVTCLNDRRHSSKIPLFNDFFAVSWFPLRKKCSSG